MPSQIVSYVCENCKKMRKIVISEDIVDRFAIKEENGLILFSDCHKCVDGVCEINNLHIDANFNVRASVPLKLPEYRRVEFDIPIPGAGKDDGVEEIRITQIDGKPIFNIIIYDKSLGVKILLGKVTNRNIPISMLTSNLGLIELEYYLSEFSYTPELEQWLLEFINIIEVLPPTKIGFIIEVFKYILEQSNHIPRPFDVRFVKTILASHEVFFSSIKIDQFDKFINSNIYNLSEIDLEAVAKIKFCLEENDLATLQSFANHFPFDFVHIIYLFLILEKENLFIIERPGIIN